MCLVAARRGQVPHDALARLPEGWYNLAGTTWLDYAPIED
jgi:hypothetical protein